MDESKWNVRRNQQAARTQSLQKDAVIQEMTNELLTTKVVSRSPTAQGWSQVHLARKPNGKWRYCIDFRVLNLLLTLIGWPLPRIKEMITRIGSKKPKYFGKIDLTSGYHQMPLAASSRKYTAFRTFHGLFEWNRVPMGIKQAAAYFQMQMAQILHERLGNGIELYLDDIIFYTKTFEEYIELLRWILTKLRKHNIVANPAKTELAFPVLEILGHKVDKDGVTFDKKKLQGVVKFPQPQTVNQMEF